MSPLQSAVLGVIEGVTEFLPISSTGHLILVSSLLNIVQSDFHKSFEIAIQLGAIFAVVVLFWKSFLDKEILKRVTAAFIPTAVAGFLFYQLVKTYLIGSEVVVLGALFVGGAILTVFELLHKEPEDTKKGMADMTYQESILVGLAQAVSIIPGTSRSAATIVGGLLLGLKRITIVEFSFLLAVPTMLAATGYDLYKNAASFSADQFGLLAIGFAVSFFVALAAIRWLLSYVRSHTFIIFGIYRMALALLFWFVLLR